MLINACGSFDNFIQEIPCYCINGGYCRGSLTDSCACSMNYTGQYCQIRK